LKEAERLDTKTLSHEDRVNAGTFAIDSTGAGFYTAGVMICTLRLLDLLLPLLLEQ
jgi:hypothetical protein